MAENSQGQVIPLSLEEADFRNTLSLLDDVAEQVQDEQQ